MNMDNKDYELVVLGGIGYRATEQDGQVIFECHGGVWGTHCRFAMEKPREINDTPGIWYLVELDASSGRVPVSHIIKAHEWCCDKFGKSFADKPTQTV